MSNEIAIVREMLAVMDRGTNERSRSAQRAVIDMLHDDLVYRNLPQRTTHGKADFLSFVAELRGMTRMTCKVLRAAATDDGWVFTQRRDSWTINGIEVTNEVVGLFEVIDGKIATWLDYVPESPLWPGTGQFPDGGIFERWPFEPPKTVRVGADTPTV